ncbi:LysR family transcriptional regulator [Corynebacterium tapiri]|uniref:LysR family transcriptional regulator n=1 Tax=Corynebacterium tapiri TaxID=1448266 RepID=A0A5C4U800_9CORY|nr:LysR family transcriptional regulator [Corynebacterium tapiri]TNM00501.1 LysR family transcriptional regulator [Corynebacterium tapiri]
MLRLGFAIGVAPDKWLRRYAEGTDHGPLHATGMDDPAAALIAREVDVALVRLPDARIDDSFHLIRLYEEEPGIAVPKESVYAEVGEAVAAADVADEIVNYRSESLDMEELRTALQVVAANVGVAFGPRPVLKALSKNRVTHLGYAGEATATSIAVAFYKDADCDAIQDFVGITKGRTVRSSRSSTPKRTAREKAAAKKQRRQARNNKRR